MHHVNHFCLLVLDICGDDVPGCGEAGLEDGLDDVKAGELGRLYSTIPSGYSFMREVA